MSSFLETLRQQTAAKAAPAAGLEGLSATPFMTAEMEDLTVPGVDPAATVAPDADVVVVVTPEDEAVDPDEDIAEGDSLEALLACEASAETYGWSPALLDFMGRQGLLNGTSLETAASFENYSMEADGAAVGGEVKAGIAERAKAWAGKLIGKIGGLWDQVSAKFQASQKVVDEAASGEISSDGNKRVIPYVKIAATVATIGAVAGVIVFAARKIDFKALQQPGAIDKAAKAIDDVTRKAVEKWPWGSIARGKALNGGGGKVWNWSKGAILPTRSAPTMHEARSAYMNASFDRRKLADAEWTKPALNSIKNGMSSAYSSLKSAVSGLYGAAKNPGAVVDGVMANPAGAAHAVGKGAVLAFVGSVVAGISWLLYHIVLKGASIVAGAVRSVVGGKKEG